MTSNVGSQFILERTGSTPWPEVEAHVTEQLRQHFRPEFLNRLDDVIVFRPLEEAELGHIVGLQLKRLEKLLADRDMRLELTEAARRHVATEGYDPVYGARPLKRAIQRLIQNPLALRILEGEFDADDTILVDHEEGTPELTFRKA